jgi:hypothetical protein
MQEISVDDFQKRLQQINDNQELDEDTVEMENRIREEREIKRTGRERLTEGAKKRIDLLLGITRLKRTVKIGEINFVLQSLKSKEIEYCMLKAAEADNNLKALYILRKYQLAKSIVEIANNPIEVFLSSNTLESKLSFIDELDDSVVITLNREYKILAKEAKERYEVKAEELADDLKKS